MADDLSVARVIDTSRDSGKQGAPRGKRRPAPPKPVASTAPAAPAAPKDETPREPEAEGGLDLLV